MDRHARQTPKSKYLIQIYMYVINNRQKERDLFISQLASLISVNLCFWGRWQEFPSRLFCALLYVARNFLLFTLYVSPKATLILLRRNGNYHSYPERQYCDKIIISEQSPICKLIDSAASAINQVHCFMTWVSFMQRALPTQSGLALLIQRLKYHYIMFLKSLSSI